MDLVAKLLTPLLDRMGTGWKRIAGLALIMAALIALQMGWIDEAVYKWMYAGAVALFGVGVIHKQAKQDQALAEK